MQRTVILGLGITGFSCLRHLYGRTELRVFDTRTAPPFLERTRDEYPDVDVVCGPVEPGALADADRIIVSPGIGLDSCLLLEAKRAGVVLDSDIDLFLDEAQAPVIGITGTNGKSTVTALAGELLRATGDNPGIGGNIGHAALDLLGESFDRYVIELSSFQLDRMGAHDLDVGVLLNVTPDHLDRYPDFDSYVVSKQRVFRNAPTRIFNRQDALTRPRARADGVVDVTVGLDAPRDGEWGIITRAGEEWLCLGGEPPLLPVRELALKGRHNHFNALTALAVVHASGCDIETCLTALGRFTGLEHRCQIVLEADGVTYINDSKATNPGAAAAALDGLARGVPHIHLIAGGDAKGAALDEFVRAAEGRVKAAYLLGKDAAVLAQALAGATVAHRVADLAEAVRAARAAAGAGDVVLLSPACASLDMFENFEARGAEFTAAVRREADA